MYGQTSSGALLTNIVPIRNTLHLPGELYRDIVEHVDNRADLHNLLSISHDFCIETERCLYKTVTFQQQPGQTDLESCQALMRLMRNQRLAVHIRALDLKSLLRPDGMSDADWREFFEVGV